MINDLDGYRMKIVLPDDTEHFIQGRVSVEKDYNDLAHAAISVEAICDPWRYDNDETVVTGTASSTVKTLTLENPGRLSVSPVLVVTGGPVSLSFGTATWNLTAGTYTLPDLFLPSGAEETLTYSGTGTIKLTWRGAVL